MASARSSMVELGAQMPSGAAQEKSPRMFPPNVAHPPSATALHHVRAHANDKRRRHHTLLVLTAPPRATSRGTRADAPTQQPPHRPPHTHGSRPAHPEPRSHP